MEALPSARAKPAKGRASVAMPRYRNRAFLVEKKVAATNREAVRAIQKVSAETDARVMLLLWRWFSTARTWKSTPFQSRPVRRLPGARKVSLPVPE